MGALPSWLLLLGTGAVSSVIAIVASMITVGVITFTNIIAIVEALAGPDVAATLLQLVGNLVYAGLVGYAAASIYIQAFDRPRPLELSLAIVGGVTALALTFGFAPFVAAFVPVIAEWLSDLPELLGGGVLALAYGVGVAAVVGVVGTVMPDPAVDG